VYAGSGNALSLWGNGKPIEFYASSGATTAMYISGTNDYIGIGVAAPTHLLHVNGIARSTQSSFATSSDRRVKKNINNLENSLETIMSLRPVTYEYVDEYVHGNESLSGIKKGFIAQEVAAVDSSMVTRTSETFGDQTIEDFNVLNTSNMTPLLTGAVQEQQELIGEQNRKIASLEEENEEIRSENQKLNEENQEIKEFLCEKFKDAPFCK